MFCVLVIVPSFLSKYSSLAHLYLRLQFVMSISNPLKGNRKGGTVGKPFPGVEVS